MIAFIVIIVVVLAVAALVFGGALPRIGRRDDTGATLRELLTARADGRISAEEFDARQAELHAAILAASDAPAGKAGQWRWLVPVVVVMAAVGVYIGIGTPKGVGETPAPGVDLSLLSGVKPMGDPQAGAQANSGGDLGTMAKRLADKLAKEPKNGEGWLLLARTYGELRQPKEAAGAYAKAAALLPPDAATLADWADAYVMSHDRKWDDEARGIVKRALAADPKHLKALALAGSEAYERSDYKAAIDYWKRMQAAAPADSMDAKLAESNIQEATAAMTGKKPGAAEEAPAGAAASAGAISGTVSVAAALKAKVSATDTVFVVVKAGDGSPMPLAVKRLRAAELPARFQLDDSAAMIPGRAISKYGEVLVSARLSKSGEATPQPGDLASPVVRVKPGTSGIEVVLAGK